MTAPAIAFIINPDLQWRNEAGRSIAWLPALGLELRASPALVSTLALFEQARTLDDPMLVDRLAPDALAGLVAHLLIVPDGLADCLGRGLLIQDSKPVARGASWWHTIQHPPHSVLLGVPADFAAVSAHSPRGGPRAVRDAIHQLLPPRLSRLESGQTLELEDLELGLRLELGPDSLRDLGNVRVWPGHERLDEVGCRLEYALGQLAAKDILPFVIGGDHSLSYYAIRALARARGPLTVLHLDAHRDDYGPEQFAPSAGLLNHANFVNALAVEPGVEHIHQVGLRDLAVVASRSGCEITRVSARQVRAQGPRAAIELLATDRPVYLSVDVDVLDPAHAPEVSSPIAGGLDLGEVIALLEACWTAHDVVGFDLMEVCGSSRAPNRAAGAAARLLTSAWMLSLARKRERR